MSQSNPQQSADPARTAGLVPYSPQEGHLNRARTSLRQAISRYSQRLKTDRRSPKSVELQSALKTDLNQLSNALDKLNQTVIRVAAFGLVSRGKSAVINALLGKKLLETGPLNGVTQFPRSVYWAPEIAGTPFSVELIDTPGLDEIGGQVRAEMAQSVVRQADLILFIIAGDITRTEYRALTELQAAHKPIILVFNKADLYPDQDRRAIYQKLQTLLTESSLTPGSPQRPFLTLDDIVLISAEPAPVQVRVEYPDGTVNVEWESPSAQIDELRNKLLHILRQEGKSLLALNALRQARETEETIARKSIRLQKAEAEELIWQYTRWKAIAIAVNPIAVLDLVGGAATDLAMIRALAKLYGLPMTRHEAGKLLNAILLSSGGLLLGEMGSGLLLGFGKSGAAAFSAIDSTSGFMAYSTAAIAQAGLAGYGSYRVGKAAQAYLERGCTWGEQGANTIIQDILSQVDSNTVINKLRKDLGQL